MHRANKWSERWDIGVVVTCTRGTFAFLLFNVILGNLVHLSQMACNTKHGWLWSKAAWNLGLEGCCKMYKGYVWPLSVQGHLRSFSERNDPSAQSWVPEQASQWDIKKAQMTKIKIKSAWHLWVAVGGQVHTENGSRETKHSLVSHKYCLGFGIRVLKHSLVSRTIKGLGFGIRVLKHSLVSRTIKGNEFSFKWRFCKARPETRGLYTA